jgi:hypothetical protein
VEDLAARERSQSRAEAALAVVKADFDAARQAFAAMERAHHQGRFDGPEGSEFTRRLQAVARSAHRAGAAIHELRA